MFSCHSDEGFHQATYKILMKTLVHGKNTLMTEFRLEQGAKLPRHSHPHEQTGYLVSGQMELTIGSETMTINPGDSWCIAGEMEHEAIVNIDTIAIEVFSPIREDYLP